MSAWTISIIADSRRTHCVLTLWNEGERRENRRRYDRFDVDSPRLTLKLLHVCGVGNLLRAAVQVAQTARRKLHSRFVARLIEAERANVERDAEREST